MTQPPQPQSIYQLRLVLSRISPMVWCRLLVSSETSVAQLHTYIQIAFDWRSEHLHRFHIQGKDYGIAYQGGISLTITRIVCHAPASVCTSGSTSATNMSSRPLGKYRFDWKRFYHRLCIAPFQFAVTEEEHRAKNMPDRWLSASSPVIACTRAAH